MRRFVFACLTLLALTGFAAVQNQPPIRKLGTLTDFDGQGPYIAPAIGTSRIYLVNEEETRLTMFDRTTKKTTLVMTGELWDPVVSRQADRIAFVRSGETPGSFIWTLPLDPKTGLAAGPARRVSLAEGLRPSFSPDGKWIAFAGDGRNSVHVMPSAGGQERKLADVNGAVTSIQWSADGAWIYFPVDAGVARNRQGQPMLQRVRLEGGRVDTVLSPRAPGDAAGEWPGLSPNGQLMVSSAGYDGHRMVVSDPEGRKLGEFTLPETHDWVWPWSGPATFLTTRDVTRSWIAATTLANGHRRMLTDSLHDFIDPAWSPDGKRIAFVERSSGLLVVMNADGSGRRTYAVGITFSAGEGLRPFEWSPDGRAMLLAGIADGTLIQSRVLDLTTGRVHEAFRGGPGARVAAWMPDSRSILYTKIVDPDSSVVRGGIGVDGACVWGPCLSTQPGNRPARSLKHEIHVVTLDGRDRLVREVSINCPACFWPIGDSAVVIGRGRESAVASLTSNAPPIKLFNDASRAPLQLPVPTISPDGRWIAFRIGGALELVAADGSSRKRIELPEPFVAGRFNPAFSGDSRSMFVVCRTPAERPDRVVYSVVIATGEVRKMVTLVNSSGSAADVSVSADGRTVAHVVRGEETAELFEVDLAAFLKPSGATRR